MLSSLETAIGTTPDIVSSASHPTPKMLDHITRDDKDIVTEDDEQISQKFNLQAVLSATDFIKRAIKLKNLTKSQYQQQQYDSEAPFDKDIMIQAMAYIPEASRDDKDIVANTVKDNGYALRFATAALRNDKDIVTLAVKRNGLALRYASEALRGDRDIVSIAVKTDGCALVCASETLQGDSEMVLLAAEVCSESTIPLKFVSEALWSDSNFVMQVCEKNPRMFQYATTEVKQKRDVRQFVKEKCLATLKKNYRQVSRSDLQAVDSDFYLEVIAEMQQKKHIVTPPDIRYVNSDQRQDTRSPYQIPWVNYNEHAVTLKGVYKEKRQTKISDQRLASMVRQPADQKVQDKDADKITRTGLGSSAPSLSPSGLFANAVDGRCNKGWTDEHLRKFVRHLDELYDRSNVDSRNSDSTLAQSISEDNEIVSNIDNLSDSVYSQRWKIAYKKQPQQLIYQIRNTGKAHWSQLSNIPQPPTRLLRWTPDCPKKYQQFWFSGEEYIESWMRDVDDLGDKKYYCDFESKWPHEIKDREIRRWLHEEMYNQ